MLSHAETSPNFMIQNSFFCYHSMSRFNNKKADSGAMTHLWNRKTCEKLIGWIRFLSCLKTKQRLSILEEVCYAHWDANVKRIDTSKHSPTPSEIRCGDVIPKPSIYTGRCQPRVVILFLVKMVILSFWVYISRSVQLHGLYCIWFSY